MLKKLRIKITTQVLAVTNSYTNMQRCMTPHRSQFKTRSKKQMNSAFEARAFYLPLLDFTQIVYCFHRNMSHSSTKVGYLFFFFCFPCYNVRMVSLPLAGSMTMASLACASQRSPMKPRRQAQPRTGWQTHSPSAGHLHGSMQWSP